MNVRGRGGGGRGGGHAVPLPIVYCVLDGFLLLLFLTSCVSFLVL